MSKKIWCKVFSVIEAYDQKFEENRTQKCFKIEADRLAAVLFKFGAFFSIQFEFSFRPETQSDLNFR